MQCGILFAAVCIPNCVSFTVATKTCHKCGHLVWQHALCYNEYATDIIPILRCRISDFTFITVVYDKPL